MHSSMCDTRFIFVEGIIGAGKSTTATFLTDPLRRNGIAARFDAEGPTNDEPDHPLRVATELPHPNAAWRDVTVHEFIDCSMRTWHAFVREVQQSAAVNACDGLLFHGM